MAANGFINSDITSENKRRWLRGELGSEDASARLAIAAVSIKVTHCAGECMSDNTGKTNGPLSHKPR